MKKLYISYSQRLGATVLIKNESYTRRLKTKKKLVSNISGRIPVSFITKYLEQYKNYLEKTISIQNNIISSYQKVLEGKANPNEEVKLIGKIKYLERKRYPYKRVIAEIDKQLTK